MLVAIRLQHGPNLENSVMRSRIWRRLLQILCLGSGRWASDLELSPQIIYGRVTSYSSHTDYKHPDQWSHGHAALSRIEKYERHFNKKQQKNSWRKITGTNDMKYKITVDGFIPGCHCHDIVAERVIIHWLVKTTLRLSRLIRSVHVCMNMYVNLSFCLSVYYVCMYNQIHTCQPICIHILCPYPPSFKAIKIRIYRGALISIFAGAPKSAASFQRFRCFWNSVLLHLANRIGRHTDMDEWHPLKTPHYQNCNKCLTPSAGTSVKPLYTAHANQYQPNCCCHIQKNDNRVGHQCVVRQMVWVSDSTPPPRKQHTLVVIFYAPKHVMAWRNIKLTFKASAEDVREHQRA